ncbi:MAG: NAD+ synthase [Candidatus Bathyarchaeia archaeon]
MKLSSSILTLDWASVAEKIKRFIKDYVEESGASGIVLGLSGGIDSSTAAALSALAIGGENVIGLMLPEIETYNMNDIEDAKLVAKKFGLRTEILDITPAIKAFQNTIPIFDHNDKLCKGNLKARVRMIFLYYYANKFNLLVCGSSDKSEVMIGYFTKWGDSAADIAPLMSLYKTQVRKLAEYIGVPGKIVNKPSTPSLWPGQTAEGEIGIKYEILDLILYGLEHSMSTEEIAEQLNLDKSIVESVKEKIHLAEHKRKIPPTVKIQ